MGLLLTPSSLLSSFKRSVPVRSAMLQQEGVGPIGFELSRERAQAVQIGYRQGKPYLAAAFSEPYPEPRAWLLEHPAELKKFLSPLLKQHRFTGRKVVACTPSKHLTLLPMEYDVKENEEEGAVILSAVEARLDRDPSELVIDYIPTRRADKESTRRAALVAVAEMSDQVAYLELLRHVGFQVERLEIGPIAIRRIVQMNAQMEQKPNVLVINCGVENSYFTLLSGRRLLLDRGVSFGEQPICEAVASALRVDIRVARDLLCRYGLDISGSSAPSDEGLIPTGAIGHTLVEIVKPLFMRFTEELTKVIAYAHSQLRGADIDRIYLMGSLARWPNSEQFLSVLIEQEVSVLNPFDGLLDDVDWRILQGMKPTTISNMALATGCSLAELAHV